MVNRAWWLGTLFVLSVGVTGCGQNVSAKTEVNSAGVVAATAVVNGYLADIGKISYYNSPAYDDLKSYLKLNSLSVEKAPFSWQEVTQNEEYVFPIDKQAVFERFHEGYYVIYGGYDMYLLSGGQSPILINQNLDYYVKKESNGTYAIAMITEHETPIAQSAEKTVDNFMAGICTFNYKDLTTLNTPLKYLTLSEQQVWKERLIPNATRLMEQAGLISHYVDMITVYHGYMQNMYVFETIAHCREQKVKDHNPESTETVHYFFGVVENSGQLLIDRIGKSL